MIDSVNYIVDTVNHMADDDQIEAVRAFNRFYTSRMGLTRGGYLKTSHPLAEARVLYELGAHGPKETSDLKTTLDIDAGQLSRLLSKLATEGLIAREPSPLDARRQRVALTQSGTQTFTTLNERSANEIGDILDALPDPHAALNAMTQLKNAIEPDGPLIIRGPDPGDLGWLVQRHGILYAREYGWDESFERLVAQIAADFHPPQDRAWIATRNHTKLGAVLCVHADDTTAKLRTLLVEPQARNLGLGTTLVNEVIEHARNRGYETLTLWTNDILTAARRIYEKAGFALQHEAPNPAFGHDLTEQTWSHNLKAWTETH
jgi:DNA-binding MarR family transcriptional regulator/N-acetylglutamate synthase-like GNAT family acetyltransferase